MADGEVVLAAVDPGEGDAVIVLLVNLSTGELAGSVRFFAPRLRDPARNEPLLAGQAGRYVRAVAADHRHHLRAMASDEESARAALHEAEAERSRVHNLSVIAADEEAARAAFLATEAERSPVHNIRVVAAGDEAARTRAALLAAEAERSRLHNIRAADEATSAALLASELVTTEGARARDRNLGATLVVQADAHGACRIIVNIHHYTGARFDRGVLAVGIFRAVQGVVFSGDLHITSGGAAALLHAAANRAFGRNLLVTSDGARRQPGPFFASVEAQVLAGACGHRGNLHLAAAEHQSWGPGAHAMPGDSRNDAEFFDRLPAPRGPSSYRNSERAQIRVFHAGSDGTHSPLVAATEDLAAVATLIEHYFNTGARGQGSDKVIFRRGLIASRGSNDTSDGFLPVTTKGAPRPPSISNISPRRRATKLRKPCKCS